MLTTHPAYPGLPAFRDHTGTVRILACRPPDQYQRSRFLGNGVPPICPRSAWQPINRRQDFPWIMDQDGVGSCTGNGCAGALRRQRRLAGWTDVALSPGCLYAQVNGGQDQGAVISDCLDALLNVGTCAYATVGEQPFFLNQLPAGWEQEASRFRIRLALHATTFDQIASGLVFGWTAPFGFMVGNNFEQWDKYGVVGHSPGPGNHCVHCDGLVLLPDGRWVLDVVNSWGATWGPFGNGRFYVDQEHLDGGGDQPDAFLIQSPFADALDPALPPPVV